MNVNSIKINNVMLDGEVDLDTELPAVIEGLEVVEGLVESATEHEAEIGGLIDNENVLGAKNLLPLSLETIKSFNTVGTWNNNVYTYHAITFTVNTDSKGNVVDITVNGTSDSQYTSLFYLNKNLVMNNNVILNGCPSGGSSSTYRLDMGTNDTSDVGNSVNVPAGTYSEGCRIVVFAYQDVTNKVFKPMIRMASDTSSTYAPYSKSNNQLTSDATMLLNNKELLGAKNMLPLSLDYIKSLNTTGTWVDNAYTINDVTYTINIDSLGNISNINVNGTASSNSLLNIPIDTTERVILTGCPSGGSSSTYELQYYLVGSGASSDYGEGIVFTGRGSGALTAIIIRNGYTANNLKFYPMIRLATDTDSTYRPYAMGNQELTQRLLSLEARVTALEG